MTSLSENPTIVKWSEKKQEAKKMADRVLYATGDATRALRIRTCSDIIYQTVCPTCGKTHFTNAMLCRDRVCPICIWRLSRARFAQMANVLDWLTACYPSLSVQMLTLTVRNCPVHLLRDTILDMNEAWRLLRNRHTGALADKRLLGYSRNIEITYSQKRADMHPHIHILLIWESDPPTEYTKQYWRYALKNALQLDYLPQCDVRKAYAKDGSKSPLSAVLEATKYVFKQSTIDAMPSPVFAEFLRQIKGLRFESHGGKVRQVKAMLGYTDDFDDSDRRHCECGSTLLELVYTWANGSYAVASAQMIENA